MRSKTKTKTNPAPCSRDLFRDLSELQAIAINSDWFVAIFVPVVITKIGVIT